MVASFTVGPFHWANHRCRHLLLPREERPGAGATRVARHGPRFYVKVFGDTFETDFDPVADYYRSMRRMPGAGE